MARDTDCRLLQSKNYEVFFAAKYSTFYMIGRLREVTFRKVDRFR
jgi:hypothetical protein